MDTSPTAAPNRPLLERRNPLGFAGLVVGAVGVLLTSALVLGQRAALGSGGVQALGALGAVQSVVAALLGIAAVVLGILGLVLPRRPRRAVAAAGLAIGAVLVFQTAVGLLSSLLLVA